MFEITYEKDGARRSKLQIKSDRCNIGSGRSNDLVIKHKSVSNRHVTILQKGNELYIEDLGTISGTWVNRERVISYGPLTEQDEITVGNVIMRVKFILNELDAMSVSNERPIAIKTEHSITTNKEAKEEGAEKEKVVDGELLYWGKIVHEQLLSDMNLRRKDIHNMSDEQLRLETEQLLDLVLIKVSRHFPEGLNQLQLRSSVLNEAIGLGPLEHFLEDESVTEIMVNTHNEVFVERKGRLIATGESFSSNQAVMSIIERIISPLGRRIDESSPMVDARLKDGSRVNAIIPPLAIKGPCLTIRKFAKKRLHFEDIIKFGSITEEMVQFLKICIEQRKNTIVSGGTGSGKTTLLNVLSNFIPSSERVVTIEDAAELSLDQPNLVSLEARPANMEGKGAVTIRELVKNSLRMRPDRIVVGECRGGEALDMLQAMNTGHDGSLTTAHANSPRDVLSRLEVMVLMSGINLPVMAIREQMSSAVDIIVQQTRYSCGARKISRITEVTGVEGDTIQLQDIFVYKKTGVNEDGNIIGSFSATGFIPTFYEELRGMGVGVDLSIFNTSKSQGASQ